MTAADTHLAASGVGARSRRRSGHRQRRSAHARREEIAGWLWIQPWLLGFLLFGAIPIGAAIVLSFTNWDGASRIRFIGMRNYVTIFTADPLFWQSLKVTAIFVLCYLPVSIVLGFGLALLMNQRFFGVAAFRTIYYLPSVLSGVAVSVLWAFVFHRDFGVVNGALGLIGIPPIGWLTTSTWVLPAIAIMQLWSVGASVIIYLGGLQGIPTELYESVAIDGAGWWGAFRAVTLPMMTPVLLLQLVIGLIGTFQIFTQAFVMTKGGPAYGSYFFSLYIYDKAFTELQIGYACALAVILLVIILLCTLLVMATSRSWVYYAGEKA